MPDLACPSCHQKMHVPAQVRQGRCPRCGVAVLVRERQRRGRNPSGTQADAAQEAQQDYRQFHGGNPQKVRTVHIPDPPKAAWVIGTVRSIEYEAPPNSSRYKDRSGRVIRWNHAAGDIGLGPVRVGTTRLMASPDGKQVLLVGSIRADPSLGLLA